MEEQGEITMNTQKPIKFDKILMYGFVRNDNGYLNRTDDKTFLNGTKKTFEFLSSLQPSSQPSSQSSSQSSSQTGGTLIRSPAPTEETTNLLRNIFLQKAGKLAEAGYKAAFVEPYDNSNKVSSAIGGGFNCKGGGRTTELINDRSYKLHPSSLSQEGGGIIDKNVVDSDRALLIAVTFVISVVVMHVKKVLYSKHLLDVNTSQSLKKAVYNIEDELNVSMTLPIEHVDEDILRENKYDSNMLLTWAITSVGVIFV
eukprot:703301-Prorocentrum_minimum.AAC.1